MLLGIPVTAQKTWKELPNGIVVNVPGNNPEGAKTVRLLVVNDEIIQVTAVPTEVLPDRQSVIRVAPPESEAFWSAVQEGETVVLKTDEVKAVVSLQTGEITFYDKNGALLLKESRNGKKFTPMEVDGDHAWSTLQQFDSPEDEAFYGLGQQQADEFNYKRKNEELYQYNTKVSIPFVVSSKNYGVLFDNYSISRFGDPRPYSNLNEVFKLYDKNGQEGALTASYYKANGDTLFVERRESRIDYETLFTHHWLPESFDFGDETFDQFPEGFRFRNSVTTWEGELEPRETGEYFFKLLYGAYTTVYLDDELVVEERWRPSWNPNSVKFSTHLTAGKKAKLRIEWKGGTGSYIGLKVLSPRPEEEVNKLSMWSEMGRSIDYYFIHGDNMDKVISGYRYVTGKSPIMPEWAMGFWQSRERYRTQDELVGAVEELRKRNFGLDNIVMDWQFWEPDAWGSQEFEKSRFPDPKKMLDDVHKMNTKFMISVWPKLYPTTQNYKDLDKNGWMYTRAVKDGITDFVAPGYLASFYDAYASGGREMFWGQLDRNLNVLGIDAWWMDASEPNIKDCVPHSYQKALTGPTALGSSTEFYNTYALVNAKAIWQGLRSQEPNKRVFQLTRSGFAGLQRYSTATWSGDIGTRWEEMKAQISAGLNFAVSGIPYWTMDIGGFCVESRYMMAQRNFDQTGEVNEDLKEWRELNARWYQFGTFTPLYRAHGQYPLREIYNIDAEGSPTYNTIFYYNKLRYKMMPYIYSLAGKTWFDDYTIMRPLIMDYPEDLNVRDLSTQYMFGPSLMVVPVYEYKATTKEVYFPAGTNWYDFHTGKMYAGGQTQVVDAPYERMPLYAPAGGILLFGPDITYVGEKPNDVVDVYVYAGKDGSFYLYEDEGTNYNYEKGFYSRIDFCYNDAGKTLTIGNRLGSIYPGMVENRTFNIHYITPDSAEGWDAQKAPGKVVNYTGKEISINL